MSPGFVFFENPSWNNGPYVNTKNDGRLGIPGYINILYIYLYMEALGDLVLPWRCVQSSHDRRRFAPNVQVETTSLLEAYSTFFMGPKECRLLRKKHAAGRRVDPQDCVFGSQHLKHGRHGSTWRIIPGTVVIESPPLIYKPWGVPATLLRGTFPDP